MSATGSDVGARQLPNDWVRFECSESDGAWLESSLFVEVPQ